MRRGHHGIGGWRNENPRHFRPRGGGAPHFRPPRNYRMMESPRFPPPGPRPLIPNCHYQGPPDEHVSQNQNRDRNKFHSGQHIQQRHDRGHRGKRPNFPFNQRMRHEDDPNMSYGEHQNQNFYENQNNQQCYYNSMGDVDHRQIPPPSPWVQQPTQFLEKNNQKPQDSEQNKLTVPEYSGHRPPASDHYGGTTGLAIDNSNAYSRSINDTVDIVRKRLMDRESHPQPQDSSTPQNNDQNDVPPTSHQEPPVKKKIHRQRQIVKSNCDKIKNKIVHQLFKMDKDKIHKLMDNPSSSSKFEYAISSLVEESQNSFNRHVRSVAEKSLSTSSEIIHHDNNTIYEDTFMKQMQCILDPQDTVLLEDIKPMVLAELSKVLQLNDFEPTGEDQSLYVRDDQHNHELISFDQYSNEQYCEDSLGYDNFSNFESFSTPQDNCYNQNVQRDLYERHDNQSNSDEQYETKPLFERRESRKSCDIDCRDRRTIIEERRNERRSMEAEKRSMDAKLIEEKFKSATPLPLFDPNADTITDDDDPFAELDKQYHVAVDHNFIENDDFSSQLSTASSESSKTPIPKNAPKLPTEKTCCDDVVKNRYEIKRRDKINITPVKVKKETDNQLLNMAKSPQKYTSPLKETVKTETPDVKQELMSDSDASICTPTKHVEKSGQKVRATSDVVKEDTPDRNIGYEIDKSELSNFVTKTSSSQNNSRKRSNEQKPSHRKEKRKKSETYQSESNKQILNKNIIINLSDCAKKSSAKCEAPKSIFNLFFAKEKNNPDISTENKKSDSSDKIYSDKYVKRKETPKKKDQETDAKKKHESNSLTQTMLSSMDNNTSNVNLQAANKVDGTTKLKTIDMFVEQPRKSSSVHQAHRNTATPKTTLEVKKPLIISSGRKMIRKHVATQVFRKISHREIQTDECISSCSRFVQTDRKRLITRASQTDPVVFKTDVKRKSSDAFERMKEIDMEIQMLLQEKFKLYSSIETKECSTMESLGMAVLNVTPVEEYKEDTIETTVEENIEESTNADTIVEDFTNIPVEELEKIAFETVDADKGKKNRRQKVVVADRNKSESPTAKAKRKKKGKTPNISLIEQIITDDRPLEDIISLDDWEDPVSKPKKKSHKSQPKSKKKSGKKIKVKTTASSNIQPYAIKECSVVLIREEVSNYLKLQLSKKIQDPEEQITSGMKTGPTISGVSIKNGSQGVTSAIIGKNEMFVNPNENSLVEETEVNDIQFDMLDVSEDIVIGDVCEIKSNDKDANDITHMSVSEEIILDNSQSSVEEPALGGFSSGECKMYDFSSDENLIRDTIVVTGNGDAVLALECVENDFIAACLDGNVYHFSGDGQLLNTLRGSNLAVTCLTIVQEKYGTTVYTGSLDSRIRYYDLETGLEKGPECNVLSPIQTMDRAWDTVFVGTRTGFVLQFECKNNMLIPVSTVKFSDQSILALRALKEGPRKVLLVAARSEAVTIKDAQTGLLLRTLEGPKMTVYTLLFEDGKVYCGTSSHQIHVFDYTSGSHVGSHEGGKGAVCLRAAGGFVFAGCYDGCVYIYREGEARAVAQLRGPSLMLLSIAIVNAKIIAGYKDRSLYIWKIPQSIVQEMIL